MGNVNMEAYQVHYSGDKSVADKLKELDAIAQQIEDLPTFTSDDRVFLEAVPAMPAAEGKTVLTAITDDQGETELTYETPEVESEDIAPEFSEEVAYGEGDLVYYEGILYKFTADHAAGAWDPSEVTQTTVAAEFNALKNTLTNVEDAVAGDIITVTPVTGYKINHTCIRKIGKSVIGSINPRILTGNYTQGWNYGIASITGISIPQILTFPCVDSIGNSGLLRINVDGSIDAYIRSEQVPAAFSIIYFEV